MLDIKIIKSSSLQRFQFSSSYETVIVMPMIDVALAKKASEVMRRRTEQNGLLLLVEDDLRLGFVLPTPGPVGQNYCAPVLHGSALKVLHQ